MDQTTTYDDAGMEQQVSPHEAGGDVGDSQDIPLPNSQEVPQLDSEDIPQPEDPALPMLKENKIYTIFMFRRIHFMHVVKNVITIYFH
jgi:hypothetical protein